MSTTQKVRRMDDVALFHAVRETARQLAGAKARNDAEAVRTLGTELRELNTELTRRETLEAA